MAQLNNSDRYVLIRSAAGKQIETGNVTDILVMAMREYSIEKGMDALEKQVAIIIDTFKKVDEAVPQDFGDDQATMDAAIDFRKDREEDFTRRTMD